MADDPIWDTWFPPNGFKCRCTVKTLSKRQMEQRGLTVETEAPRAARLEDGRFVNILPDPQFDTNPAKVRYQPDLTEMCIRDRSIAHSLIFISKGGHQT